MLPPSMHKASKENIKEDSTEATNVQGVYGVDGNAGSADTNAVTTSNYDEKDDVVMTDADVSSNSPITKNDDKNQSMQSQKPLDVPPKLDEQMEIRQDQQQYPDPVAMDTTDGSPNESTKMIDTEATLNLFPTTESESLNESTAVTNTTSPHATKGIVSLPEQNGGNKATTSNELVKTTKPQAEEESTVADVSTGSTENTSTKVCTFPSTSDANTKADQKIPPLPSSSQETAEKVVNAVALSPGSLTTPLAAKVQMADHGIIEKDTLTKVTTLPLLDSTQPLRAPGYENQTGGIDSSSTTNGMSNSLGDNQVATTTANDTAVGSKIPSLATATVTAAKTNQHVPIQEFTSNFSAGQNDAEVTAPKQDQYIGAKNQNSSKVTTESILQKDSISADSGACKTTLNSQQVPSQQPQQHHTTLYQLQQQTNASLTNQVMASNSQQQPISISNSNEVVAEPPHGVMAVSIPKSSMGKVNPLGLSTGGTPIPETNDGASNFVRNIVKNSMNNNAQHAAQPQPARPPLQPGFMGPLGGMRELRVEDALLYLDDVKREFGGRPRVYNEFLAIMKNFKSQEVDTPGVIARVSKLFRGNNRLILGFNKFLPDGYKISMEDLIQMDQAYAREEENILRQRQAAMMVNGQQQHNQQHQHQQLEAQMNLPQQRLVGRQMQQQQPPPSHIPGQNPQEQPIRDVQMEQANQQRFEATTDFQQEKQRQPTQAHSTKQVGSKTGKGRKLQQALPHIHQQQQQPQMPQQHLQQPQYHHQQQPQQVQHQAVEFDHAISYVTTIKRRFANDQSTYHSFLEILHTYQKEQRGIKEVLEQVAHLFQDHPDLLKEFTFFLPDAVQEQAKERLHRAASESESRLSAQKEMKKNQLQGLPKEVIDMTKHPRPVDQPESRGQKRYHNDVQEAPVLITYPQTPEAFVYNSAVERQFFDAAKESLASYTRDGGQAWAEFLKCLDMYAQEILSRSEMLNFVEPLLGKRNNKLFEEFKRILSAAGGQGTNTIPLMEDSWYSVPLSEIDFSRCRKCSPSYRALPRDYPAPPCSKRSEEEAKVLNDVWVSLPVGSEESYTFRHMRRNTYEETLFRVEDERFEIDMTIDSNLCTLALLEPFAQEMAQLSGSEARMQINKENESKSNQEQKGLGGKRFRYTFDPSILGVIHRNSITRIYGDSGPEMLDLMKNNPSVAIPIVVDRLRQKDAEWRRVRTRLNRHWKEMAENNYYKSLDHRSLTWRTTDKRAISNRTLLADIKDRAANDGNEGEAALQTRIDKAKEEHGSFFEVTMGGAFLRKFDLSNVPKPDRRLFTPDMSLMYENKDWVQRDAYRILSFALERGSISPTDKERCHRLWTEFLGPWFSLKLNWMLSPAVAFQEMSTSLSRLSDVAKQDDNSPEEEEGEGSLAEGERNARIVTEDARTDEHACNGNFDVSSHIDYHPLPVGSTVSTIYGEGRIICYRNQDDIYVVKLAFGVAYLRPSAVLCSILEAEKSAYTTQRMTDDDTKLDRSEDKLMIGTQSLYLFFRLHQILCHRIGIARKLAFEVKNDPSFQTLVEQMPDQSRTASGKRRYESFLSLVYALLDGGTGTAAEGGKFEDRVRSLLGHGGYELATMDKLISHILKNIQSMANDDTMWSLVQLFRRHLDAGGFRPEAFRQEAAYLSDGEHMYAFQLCTISKDRGDKSVLHVENLGAIEGSEEEDSLSEQVPEPSFKRQKR